MLDEAPHILQVRTLTEPTYDEYGRQLTDNGEVWKSVAECFCHDNSQMKQVSVDGELWTYSYHIVYEGKSLLLGTKVRCIGSACRCGCGDVIGEGEVKKLARCYSKEFAGRVDIWI